MSDTTFEPGRYLSRSWKMMTQDQGWIKPVLVLALAILVPIAGPIAMAGYCWDWARLTAWGIDSAPKQRNVDVGGCFAVGWRVTVVGFVWSLVIAIVNGLCDGLFGHLGFLGGLLIVALGVAVMLAELVVKVAQMRAVIYEKIGPGFGLSQVFDMAKRDFGGLVHIWGIELLGLLVQALIVLLFVMGLLVSLVPALMELRYYAMYGEAYYALASVLGSVLSAGLPLLVVLLYVQNIVGVITNLLVANAVGLWVRQFDLPAWGDPSDPVPAPAEPDQDVPALEEAAPVPPTPPVAQAPVTPPAPATPPTPAHPRSVPSDGVIVTPLTSSPVVSQQPSSAPAQPDSAAGYQAPEQPIKEAAMDFKPADDEKVVAPTPEEIYDQASVKVATTRNYVEPKPDAVDHMEYTPKPTEKPATASDNGVTPPTIHDIYDEAVPRDASMVPEVALGDSVADAEAEVASEDLKDKPDDVKQTPVTVPTQAEMYDAAATRVAETRAVVEPKDDAVDHLDYEPKPTEKPATASDNGVTPPTVQDIYQGADVRVADAYEVNATDSAMAAEEELIQEDVQQDDPTKAPVVQPADGQPVPKYMAPADAKGSEPNPLHNDQC